MAPIIIIAMFLVTIECTKDGIKFSCEGEVGKGGITLKSNSGNVDSVSDTIYFTIFYLTDCILKNIYMHLLYRKKKLPRLNSSLMSL